MLDDLYALLLRFPDASRLLGKTLYSLAGLALIWGAYLHVGATAASFATAMAGQPPVTQPAQLLPRILTWWAPESFMGVVFYLTVGGAGAVLAVTAKKLQRQLRAL